MYSADISFSSRCGKIFLEYAMSIFPGFFLMYSHDCFFLLSVCLSVFLSHSLISFVSLSVLSLSCFSSLSPLSSLCLTHFLSPLSLSLFFSFSFSLCLSYLFLSLLLVYLFSLFLFWLSTKIIFFLLLFNDRDFLL